MADDLTAELAEAKRIADGLQFACRLPDGKPDFFACGGPAAEAYWEYFTPARLTSLLAAVEAALKEAGKWEQDAAYTEARAVRALTPVRITGSAASAMLSGRAQAKRDCAGELRAAITAELAKEADDEHP